MWRCWALCSLLWAQGGAVVPLAHSLGIGALLHSYGLGVGVTGRTWRDGEEGRFWQLDLSSYRLREETRIRSAYRDQGGKNYVYGKVNYVYLLEGVYGYQRLLAYRSAVSALQVSVQVGIGPALALTKPYYIEIAVPVSPTSAVIKVDRYDPNLYTYTDIVGEADFYLGFDALRAIPGAVLQAAVEFDFGRDASLFRALVVGARFQGFTEGVQSLALRLPRRYWLSGFMSFYIGNAWR